jgi:hypothetical protein
MSDYEREQQIHYWGFIIATHRDWAAIARLRIAELAKEGMDAQSFDFATAKHCRKAEAVYPGLIRADRPGGQPGLTR